MDRHSRIADGLLRWAIMAAALAALAWDLSYKSLWVDEAFSLRFASMDLPGILGNFTETNPPFYHLLLHWWTAAFGTSEAGMRSMSVLFGLLAVALSGWVAGLVTGRRAAGTVMLLTALTPIMVGFGQMARGYTLYLSLTLASYGCLVVWARRGGRRWAAGYVAATVLSAYTHNYAVFNILAQQIWALRGVARKRLPARGWAVMSAAVVLGYLPWMAVNLVQFAGMTRHGFWIPRPTLESLAEAVRGFVLWGGLPRDIFWGFAALALLGLLGQAPAEAGGAPRRGLRGRLKGLLDWRWEQQGLLLPWLLCPVLVPFLWSLVGAPIFWNRYTLAAAPAFYILLARGVSRLPWRPARWAAVAAMAAVALAGLRLYYPWQMEDWRGVAGRLEAGVQPGDAVLLDPPYTEVVLSYYYRGKVPFTLVESSPGREKEFRRAVAGARKAGGRVWLVSRQEPGAPSPLDGVLREEFPRSVPAEEREYGYLLRLHAYDFGAKGARRPTAGGRESRMNVVLIVLDSQRADHLGLYGHGRPTSPRLDAFAADAWVFDRAYAQAPWTLPSVASIITSVYPVVHRVDQMPSEKSRKRLPEAFVTLAESLKAGGYVTASITAQPWFSDQLNLRQGFDFKATAADVSDPEESRKLSGALTDWLRANGRKRFFLYAHYMAGHSPYGAPPPFAGRFTAGLQESQVIRDIREIYRVNDAVVAHEEVRKLLAEGKIGAAERDYLVALYDEEVAATDAALGDLFDYLESSGLNKRTMVIVTADHGEAFFEHDNMFHGDSLYGELLRVPLVVRVPGEAGRRVGVVTQLVDIYPTVLRLLGLKPPPGLQGASLVPLMTGEAAAPGAALSQYSRQKVTTEEWAAIFDYGDPAAKELYHLPADPWEHKNVVRERPDAAREMEALASKFGREIKKAQDFYRDAPAPVVLDEATREKLRSLGYAQ